MSDTQLVVGMPAGSLADADRGGSLVNLLAQAGFTTKSYDKGGPTTFPLTSFLVGWDGRPQEFSAQLALGEIDVAIGGQDWMRERQLEYKYEYGEEIRVAPVLTLGRGSVRIVIINRNTRPCHEWLKELLAEKSLVTMVSEMPYLAVEWFQKKAAELGFGESHAAYSVQKFKTPPRISTGLIVYETWGKTEAKVKNESVDFGLEITQTGSAIRNYGLNITDVVMESEACVWASTAIKKDSEKYDLARMFLLNLYGALFAEHKALVFFNCKRDAVGTIVNYLEANALFADEPTMNEGVNYVEFTIQLDAASKDLPIAKVRYELAKLGASSIETIPLDSAIPSLDVIDF
jgi:ATP phosphoribosyltransferase